MKICISYWLLSHNTDLEIACTLLFRKLLHFALLHNALEKLLQFALKDYLHSALKILLHFASMLLHFALILHFAAIITFCGVTRMHYPFQSTGRPISHWNGLSFCVYVTPLWVFVLEWNSCPSTRAGVSSCRGDLGQHNILWWYHVNKYRAMRVNRSELASGWKSPRCHINTPLNTKSRPSKKVNPRSCFGPRILDLW